MPVAPSGLLTLGPISQGDPWVEPRISTSSIVVVLVLVIDSLDCLANAIPTVASFSCSRCFTLSQAMAIKIENENDHENEHDWRG
jgi:hypothetical protein